MRACLPTSEQTGTASVDLCPIPCNLLSSSTNQRTQCVRSNSKCVPLSRQTRTGHLETPKLLPTTVCLLCISTATKSPWLMTPRSQSLMAVGNPTPPNHDSMHCALSSALQAKVYSKRILPGTFVSSLAQSTARMCTKLRTSALGLCSLEG